MPRPAEFERPETLRKAMRTFWTRGYEATSLSDLTGAMNIGRQSLYNTFGDKHTLFLECLDQYCLDAERYMFAPMRSGTSGLPAIENYFERSIVNLTTTPRVACFLLNSAVEKAPHDPEVAVRSKKFAEAMHSALCTSLTHAKATGQIGPTDPHTSALILRNTWFGLATLTKAGASADDSRRVVDATLRMLSL